MTQTPKDIFEKNDYSAPGIAAFFLYFLENHL